MKPKTLSLEINTVCNTKCIMCPQSTLERRGRTMPMEKILRIVGDALALGVTRVQPHLYGESHLHPDYVEILHAIKTLWPQVMLVETTNGSALTKPKIADAMARYLDRLIVSLDGIHPETIERVRPGLDGAAIIRGFTDYAMREDRIGDVVVNSVEIPGVNVMEMVALATLTDQLGAGHMICEISDLNGYNDVEKPLRDMSKPCSRPFNVLTVNVNGEAILCCRDHDSAFTFGNSLLPGGLEAAWKAMGMIRDEHLAGLSGSIDICAGCTYRDYHVGA